VTAIAGLSGCGKSTTAALIMKFFDPLKGSLYIDGTNYLALTPEELRKRVIMVPQSVYVFSGTLRENLLAADPDASDEDLMTALEEVSLADWVRSQPQGLDADVGDAGAKLSGGQRQKIGIARALLKKAEYIIFDEATSSVDEKSEKEIWKCIAGLAKTRTLLIISHRLSTIRGADRIYVLEEGRVSQAGTHGELMAQDGLYRRLTRQQEALERGIAAEEGGGRHA
nr:ABC transporter ATP-binding protein/permease [Clostridia bacterium]